MKKNAMMKIAAILMVAVLLTTCAISSTFAKYTTTGVTGTDSARVAKWGVTVNATLLSNLFAARYDNDTDDQSAISLDAQDIVAPGTTKYVALTNAVSGQPEVAVEITTAAEVALDNWTLNDSKFYCPLVFKIGATEATATEINGLDYTTGDDAEAKLEKAIKDEIEKSTAEYKAGTKLEDTTGADLYISWSWAFTGVDDAKDTDLADSGASISISVTQTVSQLDTFTVTND